MTLFNPSRYHLAVFGLVCALHAGLIVWLSSSQSTPIRLPEVPVLMISLAPPEIPVFAPPPPAPPLEPSPPLEPEPAAPVIAVEKPSASKLAPVKPPREPVKIKPKIKPQIKPKPQQPVPDPPVAATKTAPSAQPSPPPVSAARYDAAYLNNPAPAYPALSRRLGEAGKVLLRAQVLPSGTAGTVEIQRSSGSPRLDAAAQKAIQGWRFVPARQGDNALASWVIIPIVFNLER